MNAHCSHALLESALAGRLPEAEEASLQRHLDECEECGLTMERMVGGAAWYQEAAALLTKDELDETVPTREDWSAIDFTVEHLEPSEEPNVLGRLGGYDVLEIIGHGGNGVVLKAFDRELKRCVAIKVLAPHLALSSLAKKRFAREAQAAAAVVHPNVLAIHQVQPSGRLPFLVMPLVAGESLAQRLSARGTLELNEILRIGMQAAAGLAAAHEQGLVHRDVKPANILLEKGVERAVLTDFGLARAADDATLTRWGIIAGTPQYMSPEQARGEPLDGRSDLFSLGCVLYEMATGVSPFRTESMMATMRRLVDDSPQAMASLNPELPPWFIAIVGRLLEKEPSKRFNSAKEVSELLEGCLAHVQQPASVPLPAGLPTGSPTRKRGFLGTASSGLYQRVPFLKNIRPAVAIALLATFAIGAWAVFVATSDPPDIAGEWSGPKWGKVVLTSTGSGEYVGSYSDTIKKSPGKIELKWSRIERRFNGTWSEGEDRFGDLSIRLMDQEIRGALTTNLRSKINLATPRLADLLWKRDRPGTDIQESSTGQATPDRSLPSPESARRSYQAAWNQFKPFDLSKGNGDDVYRRSRILLDSELQLAKSPAERQAAYGDHKVRMRELQREVEQYERGTIPMEQLLAVRFYRAEADRWSYKEQRQPTEATEIDRSGQSGSGEAPISPQSEGPLHVRSLPEGWKLKYDDIKGINIYTITPQPAGGSVLMFSRWMSVGKPSDDTALIRHLADEYVAQLKKSHSYDDEQGKYDVDQFAWDNCQGKYAAFRIAANDGVQVMFAMRVNGQGWTGQFTGTRADWQKALTLLRTLSLSDTELASMPQITADIKILEVPANVKFDPAQPDFDALAKEKGAQLLQSPRVTVFNGQEALVSVSNDESSRDNVWKFAIKVRPTLDGDTIHYVASSSIRKTQVEGADERYATNEVTRTGDAKLNTPAILDIATLPGGGRGLVQINFVRAAPQIIMPEEEEEKVGDKSATAARGDRAASKTNDQRASKQPHPQPTGPIDFRFVPADWTVDYRESNGNDVYTVNVSRERRGLSIFSRRPAGGKPAEIVRQFADEYVEGLKKAPGHNYNAHYDVEPLAGGACVGSYAVLPNGTADEAQVVFAMSINGTIWSGKFIGTLGNWHVTAGWLETWSLTEAARAKVPQVTADIKILEVPAEVKFDPGQPDVDALAKEKGAWLIVEPRRTIFNGQEEWVSTSNDKRSRENNWKYAFKVRPTLDGDMIHYVATAFIIESQKGNGDERKITNEVIRKGDAKLNMPAIVDFGTLPGGGRGIVQIVFTRAAAVPNATPPVVRQSRLQFRQEADAGEAEAESLPDPSGQGEIHLRKALALNESDLESAKDSTAATTPDGIREIRLHFTKSGAHKLSEISKASVGRRLAIVFDGRVLAAPRVVSEMKTGEAVITGKFSDEEIAALLKVLATPPPAARDPTSAKFEER